MLKYIVNLVSITILSIFFIACGSGGSSSNSNSSYTGVLQANYVKNADVKVYGINSQSEKKLIYQTKTDELGRYTIDYDSIENFESYVAIQLEGNGGTYVDEATKKEIKLIEPIMSIAYAQDIKDGKKVAITPATDIVVKTLDKSKTYSKSARNEVAQAVSKKYLGTVNEKEDNNINFFETQPIALDKADEVINSQENQKAYSTFLAGLSKLQESTSKSISEISEEIANTIVITVVDNEYTVETDDETALDATLKESFIQMNDEYSKQGVDTGLKDDLPSYETLKAQNSKLSKYQSGKAYKPGDRVKNNGGTFECKAWPEGAWCSNPVYAPGESFVWDSAWTLIESHEVEEEKVDANSWSSAKKYEAGELIAYNGKVYECKGWPYTGWCSREPGTNGWKDAWQELDYDYGDIANPDDKTDEEIKEEQEEIKNLPLKQPVLSIVEDDKTYTILIYTPYDNLNNKPKGYELYIDDKLVETYNWFSDEDVRKSIIKTKDDSEHNIFVNSFKTVASGAIEKASSKTIKVSKIKEDTSSEEDNQKNLPQNLLVTDITSFISDELGKTSSTISISGGSGDGAISIISDDTSIATIESFENPINDSTQFIITAKAYGKTKIKIKKEASSDEKYKQSNTIFLPVLVENKEAEEEVTDKQPARPIIAWVADNLEYGNKLALKWDIYWGVKGSTYKVLEDGSQVGDMISIDGGNEIGSQTQIFEHPSLNEVTTNSKKSYVIEVCNGSLCSKSNPKEITWKAKEETNSGSNENDNNGGNDSSDNDNNDNDNSESTLPSFDTKTVNILSPAALVPSYISSPSNKQEITAYFGNWKIYGANYQIANIPANKLTSLIYGFFKIKSDGSVASSDAYADFNKVFKDSGAHYIAPSYVYKDIENNSNTVGYIDKESLKVVPNLNFLVDGEKLNGNIKELMLLKVKYPHFKILPSFGGWTLSDTLFEVAKSDEKRKKFASEAVKFVRKYGFDGIDVDWEFPVRGGENPALASSDDRRNFTLLMSELRNAIENDSQIGEVSKIYPKTVYNLENPNGLEHPNYINKKLDLTIAVYAGVEDKNSAGVNYEEVKNLVDKVNIMSYDYHGSWEANNGKTGHQSALFNNNDHISEHFNTSSAFEKVSRNHDYSGEVIVNSEQISVGLGFYGRMAAGVLSDKNNGYGHGFTDTIAGIWEKGNTDYFDLLDNYIDKNGYVRYWDSIAKVPYLYNKDKKVFITYEDKASIALKSAYFYKEKASSLFFWELSQDTRKTQEISVNGETYIVPKEGDLLEAIHTGIKEDNYYELSKDNGGIYSASKEDLTAYAINDAYKGSKNKYEAILSLQKDYDTLVTQAKSEALTGIESKLDSNKIIISQKVSTAKSIYDDLDSIKNNEDKNQALLNLLSSKKSLEDTYLEIESIYKADLALKKTEKLKKEALAIQEKDFNDKKSKIILKVSSINSYLTKLKELKTDINNFLSSELFNDDSSKQSKINEQKTIINELLSDLENVITTVTTTYNDSVVIKTQVEALEFNSENYSLIKDKYITIDNKEKESQEYYSNYKTKFDTKKAIAQGSINEEDVVLPPKDEDENNGEENSNEDNDGSGNEDTSTPSSSNNEVNIIDKFTQSTKIGWNTNIKLEYSPKSKSPFSLKGAKFVISGPEEYKSVGFSCTGVSWIAPDISHEFDIENNKVLTILVTNYGEDDWIDSEFDGNIGDICTLTIAPSVIDGLDANDIKVTKVVPGKAASAQVEPKGEALVIRKDPVSLKVKGWPSYLSMGTVTDNDFNLNQKFADSQVDSIFKYEGDGFGDRGEVIEPIVTMQTIRQSREIEAITGKKVMPTLVVYTANGSGGGLAPEDIKTNYAIVDGVNIDNNTVKNGDGSINEANLLRSNLVKHFRNTIRMAAQMQANKDDSHPNPATIVLDADLFGEWQKNKLNGTFQNEYCGGTQDTDCESYKEILIKEAMKIAIDNELDYMVKKYSASSSNAAKTVDVNSLSNLYNINEIKSKIDLEIDNNIKGWVQSQNFMIKTFAPDVPFGWVINLWNPGSAHWVHKKYTGQKDVWLNASKGVSLFVKWIGAYEGDYRPDFLVFDKYERDGFSPAGKPSYAFASRQWDNYLTYVKQITDFIDTPAMIWQIPGGHLASKTEDIGDYNLLTHSATGGTYFMGDANIGKDINNVREQVLDIPLTGTHYEGATSVKELLQNMSDGYDWSKDKLRKAAYHNVFSILWGGGETTGAVKIATNGEGDNDWLKNKIVDYLKHPLPLYFTGEASEDTTSVLTGISKLDNELYSLENKMNSEVLLFDTGTQKIPSTIYKWEDFYKALQAMHKIGVAGEKFWLIDPSASEEQNIKYAKVAIAAFLAQSMQETIQYNACDENSWQFLKDAGTSEAVKHSIDRGDFDVNLPLDAACGQLGQDYGKYGVDSLDVDNPYSCPVDNSMEITATTNARYYGAAGPLFTAPNTVLNELGLLIDNKPGRWEYGNHCNGTPANVEGFEEPTAQGWEREECKVYKGQKAGSYVWDGSSKRSIEGCAWWGRGVIQTTGRENFGKLNHFLGRSHVDPKLYESEVDWANSKVKVQTPPSNPLYANMDLCSNPQFICSNTQNPELKWIAGLFYWINAMQTYSSSDYPDWNYETELKKYVNNGLVGDEFINAVSGVVNRGCPDKICPVSGEVHGLGERKDNFIKVLNALNLETK